MRRLLTFVVLMLFAVPFGISVAGCSKHIAVTYCDGSDSGLAVGQVATIDLEPRLTGISLNEGQIGGVSTPTAKDCKATTATVSAYTYGTSNIKLVDIVPTTGRLCAGTWNRNTGGGIADYTTCTSNGLTGVAYITASAGTVSSNAVPVFVHPVVTTIVLGPASTNCTADPASNCIDLTQPTGCVAGAPTAVTSYNGTACLSQGAAQQLSARTFSGTGAAQTNISCLVGPLTFTASNPNSATSTASSVVKIDQNGVATAEQPGSALINATISQSSSTAGFFATCPPQSIVLTSAGSTAAPTAPIPVTQNVQQQLTATVTDTNGNPINNITLTFQSTVPQVVPVSAGTVTPTFPGSATVNATCEPPTCNASPFDQIGLFGNGLPVTSNNVIIKATGTGNSTVLYIGSTNSQYIQPYDFTVTTQSAPVRLPYAPNSMVLSEDLSTIYMGNANEIMVYSTTTNTLTSQITSLQGSVLAVSNDNTTVVITDPVRQLVYLYLPGNNGTISTEYGGVGTHAEFSPDSQTVYITTTDGRLLVHSTFDGWHSQTLIVPPTDVAVTVPNAGAYIGGNPVTAHTACPVTTVTSGAAGNQTTSNVFYPLADTTSANADRIAATNDGVHILGASASAANFTDIQISPKTGACPIDFSSTTNAPLPFVAAVPAVITGVLPTSDSAFALITYTGTGAVVPEYTLSSKTLANIPLLPNPSGTPTAPVAGVFSSDDLTAYIGTSGDNVVHLLTRGLTGFTDTATPLTPALPGLSGGIATPNLLVQRPRKGTS